MKPHQAIQPSPPDDPQFGAALAMALTDPAYRPPVEMILCDPDRRAAIVTENGYVVFASERYLADFTNRTRSAQPTAEVRGCQLSSLHPLELAVERMNLVATALRANRSHIAYQMLGGRRFRMAVHPLANVGHAGCVLLVLCQTQMGDLPPGLEGPYTLTCQAATLGDLGGLTIRELDVMRCLAMEWKRGEIAELLASRVRNVQELVRSACRKLKLPHEFALTVFALRIGLSQFNDEQWGRMIFLRNEQIADAATAKQRIKVSVKTTAKIEAKSEAKTPAKSAKPRKVGKKK